MLRRLIIAFQLWSQLHLQASVTVLPPRDPRHLGLVSVGLTSRISDDIPPTTLRRRSPCRLAAGKPPNYVDPPAGIDRYILEGVDLTLDVGILTAHDSPKKPTYALEQVDNRDCTAFPATDPDCCDVFDGSSPLLSDLAERMSMTTDDSLLIGGVDATSDSMDWELWPEQISDLPEQMSGPKEPRSPLYHPDEVYNSQPSAQLTASKLASLVGAAVQAVIRPLTKRQSTNVKICEERTFTSLAVLAPSIWLPGFMQVDARRREQ